jgi:bacterioferritin B
MLISKSMNQAVNEQIGNEFSASLQYVAIASHFASETLPELSRHFYAQADEERDHGMRFVKYLVTAGGQVEIPAIAKPKIGFTNVEDAIRLSLEQEKIVTQQINDLVDLALKESDHITRNFLNWFLTEQLEEVSSMQDLLTVAQRAGLNNLLYIEEYLARHSSGQAAAKVLS